jgi:hypothetical protein
MSVILTSLNLCSMTCGEAKAAVAGVTHAVRRRWPVSRLVHELWSVDCSLAQLLARLDDLTLCWEDERADLSDRLWELWIDTSGLFELTENPGYAADPRVGRIVKSIRARNDALLDVIEMYDRSLEKYLAGSLRPTAGLAMIGVAAGGR